MSMGKDKYDELTKIWKEIPNSHIIGLDLQDRPVSVYNAKAMDEWLYGKLEAWLLKQFYYTRMTYDDGFAIGVGQ